jgi:hypothetical protein
MADSTQKQVRLSSKELEYLTSASFLPATLVPILSTALVQRNDAFLLSVSRDVAEEFRSAFMHRVAVAGLGPDYEPNSEGRMLEELIDRFYFGEGRG